MSKAKDPNFDKWAETWDGVWTLFRFYWPRVNKVSNNYPHYVRENMTIDEIKLAVLKEEK